jgi:flagellar hook-associated protein 2
MANTIFTGSSRYATDFTQIIDRAVSIASLPLTQLAGERTRLNDQSSALSGLSGKVSALRSAINAVQDASGPSSYAVSTSDGAVVSPTLSGSTLPGTYDLEIIGAGARTNTSSNETLPKVIDAAATSLSSASSFSLVVDGVSHSLTPSANTLDALAASINGAAAGVQAVIVNVGSAGQADLRLSIQSKKLGPVDIQLNDGAQDLLTTTTTGVLASYRVNGQPAGTPITSDTTTGVQLAPGLSVDLLKSGVSTVTVGRSTTSVSNALSAFARAYNDLLANLDTQRGSGAGALAGQSLISELTSSLRRIGAFSGTGSIKTIGDLGLSFNDKGVMSFDATVLTDATASSLQPVLEFFGSSNDGFLGEAERLLDSLDTEGVGLLPAALESTKRQITATDNLIAANQERIDLLRQTLVEKISAADALIASLEQQVNYMNGLLEATRLNVRSLI